MKIDVSKKIIKMEIILNKDTDFKNICLIFGFI